MEAHINENCPERMFPAVGMSTKGTGTVCVCVLDPANWVSVAEDPFAKHAQVLYRFLTYQLGAVAFLYG